MTDIETHAHEVDGIEEVWVADPCGGAFGGGSSEVRIYHVDTDVIDAAETMIDLWDDELSEREPVRILKPECIFAI